uniref:Uncharacterized protein n=1 Tax=Guillardia theta TaxID=55529 RepID=A0A7S4KWT5_GUITH|mmetsp:Transcript_32713/g.103549  ORF Transcript_32713/g.103549 Transcript_32713/m.103549 type:complete len:159 (+) Transcript_32713:205-681(+)
MLHSASRSKVVMPVQQREKSSSLLKDNVGQVRTSESHPITVSFLSEPSDNRGNIGLCYCPGKNVDRDGVRWRRDLDKDLATVLRIPSPCLDQVKHVSCQLKSKFNIDLVVCLLSISELRHLGVKGSLEEACKCLPSPRGARAFDPTDDAFLFRSEGRA